MNIGYYVPIIMIVVILIVGFIQLKRTKCPVCGKFMALKVSGQTNLEKYTKTEKEYVPEKRTTRTYISTYQKYITHHKCSYCSYTFDEKGERLLDKKSA